jgi:RNA polymerase sigma-70 factor (ECF subfamily)
MSSVSINPSQISQLFENHNSAIVAFLVNRVACPETAQDLSQETYLRLLKKGEIPHDENIIGYLFRIADRLAIDYLRQTRLPRNNVVELTEALQCPQPQPDELNELRQQCQIVLNAINALPQKCRDVFLLRKIDEFSYNEIARQLGISEKTVQRYLVNAMLHCHYFIESYSR